MAAPPSSLEAVESFLAELRKFTEGLSTKTTFGFQSKYSFAPRTYVPAVRALVPAVDRMQDEKFQGDRIRRGTGISTNETRMLLADLLEEKSITTTPSKFKALLAKLTNAKELVKEGVTLQPPPAQPVDSAPSRDAAAAAAYYANRTPGARLAASAFQPLGGRKTRKLGNKFSRCVKSVRKTVRARPKSSTESAAIAICTKSVLQTRGLTMKRYRKGRLTTQRKFRGGGSVCS
jgi:hypothetical protein